MKILTFCITYILPILALVLSAFAFLSSKKVNDLEVRLKRYTLNEIKKSSEANEKANVIAEILHYYDFYKIRLYNLGPATAYNVDFELPSEISEAVTRNKVPYEQLDYASSFVEDFAVTLSTPEKFEITISWEDSNGARSNVKKILSFQ